MDVFEDGADAEGDDADDEDGADDEPSIGVCVARAALVNCG
jgi:hypothetical protein